MPQPPAAYKPHPFTIGRTRKICARRLRLRSYLFPNRYLRIRKKYRPLPWIIVLTRKNAIRCHESSSGLGKNAIRRHGSSSGRGVYTVCMFRNPLPREIFGLI